MLVFYRSLREIPIFSNAAVKVYVKTITIKVYRIFVTFNFILSDIIGSLLGFNCSYNEFQLTQLPCRRCETRVLIE